MSDPVDGRVRLRLPERFAIRGRIFGAEIAQLSHATVTTEVEIAALAHGKFQGFRGVDQNGTSIAIIDRDTTSSVRCDAVLRVPDASTCEAVQESLRTGTASWIYPKARRPHSQSREELAQRAAEIRSTWKPNFTLRAEEIVGDTIVAPGLRAPQVGAVYATYAHWSVSEASATIVMPTGTGKTETMLALLVSVPLERVLIVVPNDALRSQVTGKFLTLSILKDSTCLDRAANHPIVAKLRSTPKTVEEVDEIFLRSNVIVSTMTVIAQASSQLQERMSEHVSALIVDEAHHIRARTWSATRAQFKQKRILQFTATPFRNDGGRVDGRFIYVYPLWKAQEEKLFKAITFVPVFGLDHEDADDKIIAEVRRVLTEDGLKGHRHLVMARAENIERATSLFQKYRRQLPEFSPVLIHSQLAKGVREASTARLIAGECRIAVCVDMLGEGFDLPDLKIAALHDKHKSEAVTFQFVGRFTRSRPDLGDATVIANITGSDVKESLRPLYSQDADWNRVLNIVGGRRTEKEVRREEVFAGFSHPPERFPLETLQPRMSTVVYKTACLDWSPYTVEEQFEPGAIVEGPHLNVAERLLIFVRRDEERLRWSSVKEPRNVEYNLFMVHWEADRQLLFINSSNLGDLHLDLAQAICGSSVERIAGEPVFRVLDGFRRLVLMNLGLSETQRKPVRYSSFMGSDIAEQLETLPGNRNRTKTNLFGQGYTDEGKSTIGCSVKGKVWSYEVTNNFGDWIDWCHEIGRKLLDETITTDNILRRLVRPTRQNVRPPKMPIAIAWPEGFLHLQEDRVDIEIDGGRVPFFECTIDLVDSDINGPIVFRVGSDERSAVFEMTIDAAGAHYQQVSGPPVIGYVRARPKLLREWFREDPPHIYFADGDMLVDHDLFVLPKDDDRPAFDLAKIEVLDWSGVDIRIESRTPGTDDASIQGYMTRRLLSSDADYDVIFDDDGAGEVADIIAMRLSGQTLKVDLYHCKYSSASEADRKIG